MNLINKLINTKLKDVSNNLDKVKNIKSNSNPINDKALMNKLAEDLSVVIGILSNFITNRLRENNTDKN